MNFDYNLAFSRNLGWFSRSEQKTISEAVIAIPGMGGVGGHHLHSLARLGFRNFKIADFDHFEVHNFNRQIGASISTLHQNKAEVMAKMILDIIPDAKIEVFKDGVNESNYDAFIEGVDVIIDGLDVYVITPRIHLFDKAIGKGIPVVIAGPLGMGTAALVFKGYEMSFSSYFNLTPDLSEKQLVVRFLAGMTPVPSHIKYLFHREEVKMSEGRAPSLHTGVLAATTFVAAVVPKLVLGRGRVFYVPWSYHYDFYLDRFKRYWRPWGNKNPLQKVLIYFMEKLWDKI